MDLHTDTLLETLLANRGQFLGYVTKQVGDRAAAEDILQSAYLRSITALEGLRDDDSVVGWFYRVLKNAITDYHRRAGSDARARAQLETEPVVEPELLGVVCACVRDVLSGLPPNYSEALSAVELEELSVDAYARRAGISPGNASVRLHRARRSLADRLIQVCGSCAEHKCADCSCRRPPESSV